MSTEATGFNIQNGIQALRQVGSQQRPKIYAEFVKTAGSSPLAYIDSITELQQLTSTDKTTTEYAQTALRKILERVKPAGFTGADLTAAYPQLLDLLATDNKELAESMIQTLLNKPGERLLKGVYTEEDVWTAAEEATSIMETLSMTCYQSKNKQAVNEMANVWRQYVINRDASRINIVDILNVASELGKPAIGSRAYAAKSLITGIEIREKGPITHPNPQTRHESMEAQARIISPFPKPELRKIVYPMEEILDEMELNIQQLKDRKFAEDAYIHSIELLGDEIPDAALQLHMQNTVTMCNQGTIRKDLPKNAVYRRLPGGKLLFVIPISHEIDANQLMRIATETRVNQLSQNEKQKKAVQLTAEELNTIVEFGLPPIDEEFLDYYNEEKKAQAMAGIYGLSNRGDKVVVHDSLPSAAGIKDIVFKNFSDNEGKSKRQTVADIDVLGTTFRCVLDNDYTLHVPDGVDERAQKFLQSIVYTYLAELRSGKHDASKYHTHEGPNAQSADTQFEKNTGRRPHLRVLPIGQKAHTLESEKTKDYSTHVFGHPISEINALFIEAQRTHKIPDNLPISLRNILQTLLDRSAGISVQEVTFVNDASMPNQPPKKIMISAPDLVSLFKK